jgi:hypothetical protein
VNFGEILKTKNGVSSPETPVLTLSTVTKQFHFLSLASCNNGFYEESCKDRWEL